MDATIISCLDYLWILEVLSTMSNQTLRYNGYEASFEVDFDDFTMYGKIIGINDLIMFEGNNPKELQQNFQLALDEYIAECKEAKREPDKPYI